MKSMTGYGSASGRVGHTALTVEIRSVNQRFLDLKVNGPREYGAWEADIRGLISAVVSRGRVEVYIGRNAGARAGDVELRKDVAAAYLTAWRGLKKEFGLPGEIDLPMFLAASGVFQTKDRTAPVKAEKEEVKKLVGKALVAHGRERAREGRNLQRDMRARTRALSRMTAQLKKKAVGQAEQFQARVERRVQSLLDGAVDEARLAQEAAILAERADVTEEIVRLESHVEALSGLLRTEGPLGKKVDFLLQEVNREINTIASKSSDLTMTSLTLEGKSEVEKLREQAQNVE